jgi:hypothetical protein
MELIMAQVISPNVAQKDDALTTIMKGLSIASQIYGIKANMTELEKYDQEKKHQQDLAQGKYNKDEQVRLGEKFDVSRNQPSAGNFSQASDLESGSPLFLSLRKKATSPILKEIKGMKGSEYGTIVNDYQSGTPKEIDFIADKPSVEKPASPVRVDTVDDKGNPVIKFVTPVAGDTYQTSPANKSGLDPIFQKLPKPAQEQVQTLATKIATKTDIANLMDAELKNFKTAYENGDKTQAIKSGEGMLKLLNSAVSTDAVGKEEAERLGSLLSYQILNITGAGPVFGRDLKGFYEQVASKTNAIKQSAQSNQNRIDEIYSGKYGTNFDTTETSLETFGSKTPTSGEAIAAPSAPKVGTEDSGYIFQGGDAADPKSWKKK